MIQDSDQTPHLSRRKCANCGLVNTGSDELCRRCGTPLDEEESVAQQPAGPAGGANVKKRRFLKRVTWILGATYVILVLDEFEWASVEPAQKVSERNGSSGAKRFQSRGFYPQTSGSLPEHGQ